MVPGIGVRRMVTVYSGTVSITVWYTWYSSAANTTSGPALDRFV